MMSFPGGDGLCHALVITFSLTHMGGGVTLFVILGVGVKPGPHTSFIPLFWPSVEFLNMLLMSTSY